MMTPPLKSAGTAIPSRFRAEPVDRTPWSQHAIHLVIALAGRLDADRLRTAVRLTLDAEPILGCRFVEHWFRPYWQRYEDLDGLPFFEVRETNDAERELRSFLTSGLTLPVRVLLLRENSDRVCVKLAHHVGDGGALAQIGVLLADTYTRLRDDPDYRPLPRTDCDRSIRPISSRFSARQRLRLLREAFKTRRRQHPAGSWRFPPADAAGAADDFLIRRLGPKRVRGIGRFAYRRRATPFQVLFAAFFLALCDSIPHSSDRPLRVLCPVDLRRYLGAAPNRPLCNLTGLASLTLSPGSAPTFDDVLAQIRDQMYSQWKEKTLGLVFSGVASDIPVLKQLMGLVPYAYWMKRRSRAAPERYLYRRTRRAIVASYGGDIPGEKLRFGDVHAIDAFGTGGVYDPALFGLAVTTFAGSMTLSIGCGPSALLQEIFERTLQRLPDE